jgi:hypothetical protein
MKKKINELDTVISRKNSKVPFPIFNPGGPAKLCPSEKLGLCNVCHKCYAKKAEIQYPNVLPYRLRQLDYWNKIDAFNFVLQFKEIFSKKIPLAFRFSESSDVNSQSDIDKINIIADHLQTSLYIYSCRSDLSWKNRNKLVVNFSGLKNFDQLKNNNCDNLFIAIDKDTFNMKISDLKIKYQYDKIKKCYGDCKKCKLCTIKGKNIILCKIH